mmetsp:Transcript_14965/g.42388  ORF Transcript_14965/g.42388 Transcript_14965/m.42388 type:complete len:354 (+) Transcript_14965:484-1545(+)
MDDLWQAAGAASAAGAGFVVALVSAWVVFPVNFLQRVQVFEVARVSSTEIAAHALGLVLPVIALATGGLSDGNAFEWAKTVSLIVAAEVFAAIKYHLPDPHLPGWCDTAWASWYAAAGHGILVVNMVEAVVWESRNAALVHSYANAAAGTVQALVIVPITAARFKLGRRDGPHGRELLGNLTPFTIAAYTAWDTEYNAVFHPHRAGFYVPVTLGVPLLAAFVGGLDWLDVRAQALLHAILLRIAGAIGGPTDATLGHGQTLFESDVFRGLAAWFACLFTGLALCEALLLTAARHPPWTMCGLGRRVEVVDAAAHSASAMRRRRLAEAREPAAANGRPGGPGATSPCSSAAGCW